MCCFSGKVQKVQNTRIFGRVGSKGNQVLIYQMSLKSDKEVAMILPIPVKAASGEDAVRFFDFSGYPQVFDDLENGFHVNLSYSSDSFGGPVPAGRSLEVVSVGSYDASYVPSIADFSRLDPRFQLPAQVWPQLPAYRDFGFAVFKLKAGDATIHPMAFSFPTARPSDIFFPTLHIHDGKIHERERFDHTLYCQASGQNLTRWEESPALAITFAKCGLTHNMIKPDQHVYRQSLVGKFANADIVAKPS